MTDHDTADMLDRIAADCRLDEAATRRMVKASDVALGVLTFFVAVAIGWMALR